ncbi:MAG: hypothetical protein HQK54_09265 [Oligoflexales bacterium]|nr:hypothetical protein [Oligoflexales bacterium]
MKEKYLILFFVLIFVTECKIKKSPSIPLRMASDNSTPYPDACTPASEEEIGKGVALLDEKHFIAHAAGAMGDQLYTESLEALDSSYSRGYRLIEIDLNSTSDNVLVGIHDWQTWRENVDTKLLGTGIPTKEQFFTYKPYPKLTPLDYPAIAKWFDEKKDAILVTDKTEDLEYLANNTPFRDRLMVEVFSFEKYVEALKLNIRKPMLSYDSIRLVARPDEIYSFVDSWKVSYFTLSTSDLKSETEVIKNLRNKGVCVWLYKTEDPKYMNDYLKIGIFGFYTDYFFPEKAK